MTTLLKTIETVLEQDIHLHVEELKEGTVIRSTATVFDADGTDASASISSKRFEVKDERDMNAGAAGAALTMLLKASGVDAEAAMMLGTLVAVRIRTTLTVEPSRGGFDA